MTATPMPEKPGWWIATDEDYPTLVACNSSQQAALDTLWLVMCDKATNEQRQRARKQSR